MTDQAVTREQLPSLRRENPEPADCDSCARRSPVSHWPSPLCRSSINAAGVVIHLHCTCDFCF